MKILVTAFGPFDGRSENASSLALRELKKQFPGIRTRTLPVDAVIAPARLRAALRSIQPDVLIMLGEAAGSTHIRLETTAWNELDFVIPDAAGRQPRKRVIKEGGRVSLAATLSWESILGALLTENHQAGLSEDPGRYLCNQIFYVALAYLREQGSHCDAGFVHLPLAEHYPTHKAAAALHQLIRVLREKPMEGAPKV